MGKHICTLFTVQQVKLRQTESTQENTSQNKEQSP